MMFWTINYPGKQGNDSLADGLPDKHLTFGHAVCDWQDSDRHVGRADFLLIVSPH